MKNFKLLLVGVFMLATLNSFGQTTETEYNYLRKGYKIQQESGLDMKKGYSMKDVDTWGVNYSGFDRNVTFKFLYRDGETIPCATLMIFDKTNSSYQGYLCIPHYSSSEEIWKKAFNDFYDVASDWSSNSKGYVWGMIKMMSYMNSGIVDDM